MSDIIASGTTVYLVASGDARLPANKVCWPAQKHLEKAIVRSFASFGVTVKRAHEYDDLLGHGFIDSQRKGLDILRSIPENEPIIVACAVWQFSHHVLPGLLMHKGPVFTIGNWSGQWPGLVGLLNLNASLTKAGRKFATAWTVVEEDGSTEDNFHWKLAEWLRTGEIGRCQDFVTEFVPKEESHEDVLGQEEGKRVKKKGAIMGILDEGCMGMYNGIIDDHLLIKCGIFKERMSQSMLLVEMSRVSDEEAKKAKGWLDEKGLTFEMGEDDTTELTLEQVIEQMKMYIAMVRLVHRYGLDVIGIQFQLGLLKSCACSDLPEGLLNNADRPPVYAEDDSSKELFPGHTVPCFNEADEGAGLDAFITSRVCKALGIDGATTLHDVRYGEMYNDQFVWVFEISGSAPVSHFANGYQSATSFRQPPMYFPRGGGTLSGVSRPGRIVWSRIYVVNHTELHCDIGLGTVLDLPEEETRRRLDMTTKQWPIMNAVLDDLDRDEFMGRHKANHVQVVYAGSNERLGDDLKLLRAKAGMMHELGICVHVCGVYSRNPPVVGLRVTPE